MNAHIFFGWNTIDQNLTLICENTVCNDIDKGKILLQKTVEDLLETGYSVSGLAQEVDRYCDGRNVIGYDELGNLKVAYVLGEKAALPQGSNLQIAAMNLQKLFVKMTEKGEGENE